MSKTEKRDDDEPKIPPFTIQIPDEIAEEFSVDAFKEALALDALAVQVITKAYRLKRREAAERHIEDFRRSKKREIPTFLGQGPDPI